MRALSLVCCVILGACATSSEQSRVRATQWAQPVIGGDVDNWHKVSDELYRCAQPSAAGMKELQAFGIASVVNLREIHSDRDEAAGSDLVLLEMPVDTFGLTYERLVEVLAAIVAAPKPVAVHCWRGSDRTGSVVAAWRVAIEGWTPEAALDEMVAGGFGHSFLFVNLRRLIGGLDPERLRVDLRAAVSAHEAAQ